MGDLTGLIADQNDDEVLDKTLDAGQVPQGGTLPKGSDDVDKKLAELSSKYERDIANIKSTFQRTEAQLRKELEGQRDAYNQSLREAKLSKMDEEERKKYEAQELLERNKNYEAEALAAKQALLEREQMDQYKDFFASVGIAPSQLDSTDLNSLVNSGYALWKKRTEELAKKVAALEKQSQPDDEEIVAPEVDTTKGKPPKGNTWPALIQKYGSMERVFRLVELGELPPTILPPA